MSVPLVVLDTMVVVSAIFSDDADGPSASVVRVLGYEGVEELVGRPVRAFGVALDVGAMGFMHHPRRLDRPSLRDPKDGWIFDLDHASGADHIVSYDNAVQEAADELGFVALSPEDLLETSRRQYDP